MNFYDAINAHVAWKVRLQRCVAEGNPERLNALVLARDDICELGLWIHGEVSPYHQLLIFRHMEEEHARFHRCAGEVVRLWQEGKPEAARALLDGEYSRLSHATVNVLTRMAMDLQDPDSEEA